MTAYHQVVPTRFGPMLANVKDQFVGRSLITYGEFSPGEARFFRAMLKPGMTVIEGGANCGAHTIALAWLVGPEGRVLAFEPQRLVFQQLCANLALNCLTNVWAYWSAVGNRTGHIQVVALNPDVDNNFGGLTLGSHGTGVPYDQVPIIRLDLFLTQPRVDFLKLDVEGMETDALDGARMLIGRHRPLLYVENDRAEKATGLLDLLGELGYAVWKHEPPLYEPANFRAHAENVFGEIVSHNLIGVPTERVNEFVPPTEGAHVSQ